MLHPSVINHPPSSVSVKISLCSCFLKLLRQDVECFDAECFCYVEGLLLEFVETVKSSLLNVFGKLSRFSLWKRFSQKSVNSFVLKIKGTILHSNSSLYVLILVYFGVGLLGSSLVSGS